MSNTITNIERGCRFQEKDDEGAKELVATSCGGCCNKLSSFDWLSEYGPAMQDEIFEIRFKNTRKSFFANVNKLDLEVGDIVAVESSPGHDIGIVSLRGDIVSKQMRKSGFRPDGLEFKKIYRKAKPYDIEKWQEAIGLEHQTMIDTRIIASDLGLNMKIGDVEYQGDRLKAIFYYIADERVDFRELIKLLADRFKIRVEMKQIGARQEAGRIGGIGSCGRELCCASFISNFVSVTTNSARFQEILLNPQKLAGQCGKLKCCLNYEVDAYINARRDFPKIHEPLDTIDGRFFHVKNDIFKKEMSFSSDPHVMANYTTISTDRVWEIIKLNKRGVKVDKLNNEEPEVKKATDYKDVIEQESITRFDTNKANPRRNRKSSSSNTKRTERTERPERTEQSGERRERIPRGEEHAGAAPQRHNNRERGENTKQHNAPRAKTAPSTNVEHKAPVATATDVNTDNGATGAKADSNINRNRPRRNNGFRKNPRPQNTVDKVSK